MGENTFPKLTDDEQTILNLVYEWEWDPPEDLSKDPEASSVSPVPYYLLKTSAFGHCGDIKKAIRWLLANDMILDVTDKGGTHARLHRRLKNGNVVHVSYGIYFTKKRCRITYQVNTRKPEFMVFAWGHDDIRWYTLTAKGIKMVTTATDKAWIPNYAQKALLEYRKTVEAFGLIKPTDREVYNKLFDTLKDSDKQHDLPNCDTWQRNLRTGRRLTKQQKNAPRAGRECRSAVKMDQIEPHLLPTSIKRKKRGKPEI